MQRDKTLREVREGLYQLSYRDIRQIVDTLKYARNKAKELSMIERGRKIHEAIETAIEELEDVQKYLEDYPTTKTDMTGVPIG